MVENDSLSVVAQSCKRILNGLILRHNGLSHSSPLLAKVSNRKLRSLLQSFNRGLPASVTGANSWLENRQRAVIERLFANMFAESNRKTSRLTGLDLGGLGYEIPTEDRTAADFDCSTERRGRVAA